MADDQQLEELEAMSSSAGAIPQGPPAGYAPTSTRQAFPQLYRFFWGGLIVFVGALLPFGSKVVESIYGGDAETTSRLYSSMSKEDKKRLAETLGTDQPTMEAADETPAAMPSIPAFKTFTGAIFLLFGIILMGQMYGAIQERKVALGGVLLMFFPAGWTWFKAVKICGELEWFKASELYLLNTFDKLALDLGSGFMLILGGSTYVVFNFLRALFGAATGGKKAAAPAPARSRRSSSRRDSAASATAGALDLSDAGDSSSS